MAFVRAYAKKDFLQAELGYYFASLEVATEYIKDMSDSKVIHVPLRLSTTQFMVCERERYRRFVESGGQLEVTEKERVLKGYRGWVVEEFVHKPGQFYCTVAEATGREEDTLTVLTWGATELTPVGQQELLQSVFLSPSTPSLGPVSIPTGADTHADADTSTDSGSDTDNPCETASLLVLDEGVDAFRAANPDLTLLPLPSGDYDAIHRDLIVYLTLKRVSLPLPFQEVLSLHTPSPSTLSFRATFTSTYSFLPDPDAYPCALSLVEALVADVASKLEFLNYLVQIPGFHADKGYTDLILLAVKAFQNDYNNSGITQGTACVARAQEVSFLVNLSYLWVFHSVIFRTTSKSSRLMS